MLRFASLNPVGKLRMEGHKLCPQFHGHRTTDLRFQAFGAILYPAKNKTNFTKSSGAREHRIEVEGLAHHPGRPTRSVGRASSRMGLGADHVLGVRPAPMKPAFRG